MSRRRNAIPRNEAEAQDRERALATLALKRRKPKISLTAAAAAEGSSTGSVLHYAGSTIRQDRPGGRYRAAAYDRIPREMNFYSDSGNVPVTIRDSRTASAIGRYSAAYRKYRAGDSTALAEFKGKSFIASGVRYRFVTDPDRLDLLVDAGLTPDAVYRAAQMPIS